jgi:hypothetical protein
MEEQLLSLPGEITKVTTMSHNSVRLVIDSQENVDSEIMAKLFSMSGKVGYFNFLPEIRPIQIADVLELPPIERQEDETKSPAQRLRAVIYVLGKQKGEKDMELFYRRIMDKLIEQVKEKLI